VAGTDLGEMAQRESSKSIQGITEEWCNPRRSISAKRLLWLVASFRNAVGDDPMKTEIALPITLATTPARKCTHRNDVIEYLEEIAHIFDVDASRLNSENQIRRNAHGRTRVALRRPEGAVSTAISQPKGSLK
jgi:hypothetical protein